MIPSCKKKADIATAISLGAMTIFMVFIFLTKGEGNILEESRFFIQVILLSMGLSMGVAAWFYMKAKGYWGIAGILLLFLYLPGFMIMLLIPDRMKD